MIKRWEHKRDELAVAVAQGRTLEWMSANILGGMTREAVRQNLIRLGIKKSSNGKRLTNHHSLIQERLFICKCGEFGSRDEIRYHPVMCRKCNAKRSHDYLRAHPEAKEQAKLWKSANREKVLGYLKKYYETHKSTDAYKQKKVEKSRKYRESAAYREWYEKIGREKAKERYLRKKMNNGKPSEAKP